MLAKKLRNKKKMYLDDFEYTGPDDQTCQITLTSVIAGEYGPSGKWKCKVEDWKNVDQEEATGIEDEKFMDIKVTAAMEIKQFKTLHEPQTIRKGATIDFKCLGNQAFGKCKIHNGNQACTFDGGVKSNDALCSRLTLNNKQKERCLVTMTDLSEADSGDWSCELNDISSQTTHHLNVIPELAVTASAVEGEPIPEGQNVDLSCSSNEEVTTCTFQDAAGNTCEAGEEACVGFDGRMTATIDTNTCVATLETVANENNFTCTLGSADGEKESAQLQLNIKEKFKVTIQGLDDQERDEGENVTLTCQGNHEIESCAFEDGVNEKQDVSDSVDGKTCEFKIHLTTDHNGKQITCELTEKGGTGEPLTASVEAIVKGTTTTQPPSPSTTSNENLPTGASPDNELITIIVVVVVACLIIGVAIFVFLRYRKNKEQSTNERVMNVDIDDEEKNPLNNANEKEAV
jgi:hypothetical protein